MEKISNIIGKPVISIFDGVLEGYVKNIYVDKMLKKVKWICIFDDQTEEEKLINTKMIFNFDQDAIMIKNNTQTFPLESMDIDDINPIDYRIFKCTGKECGKILDIEFDERFYIQNIILNNQQIDNIMILKVGKNIIIEKNIGTEKLYNFGPKRIDEIKPTSNEIVTIQTPKRTVPTKILTSGYSFLIGRKVGQNIYSENGTVIAKKQSVITQTIIDLASKNGKLNELTKYSLT